MIGRLRARRRDDHRTSKLLITEQALDGRNRTAKVFPWFPLIPVESTAALQGIATAARLLDWARRQREDLVRV